MDTIPKKIEVDCFNGMPVRIEYLGQFRFECINMYIIKDKANPENDELVYFLIKEITPETLDDKFVWRREYTGDGKVKIRGYIGWRKSFIEFCRRMKSFRHSDLKLNFYKKIAREFGVKKKEEIIYTYAGYYDAIFRAKKEAGSKSL